MSYRCTICDALRARGQPLLKHVITRRVRAFRAVRVKPGDPSDGRVAEDLYTREEIERELPVCAECDRQLKRGTPLDVLANLKRIERLPPPPPKTPVPVGTDTLVPKAITW